MNKPTYEELAAQVEVLNGYVTHLIERVGAGATLTDVTEMLEIWVGLPEQTPSTCLAQVKAEAFNEGGSAQKAFWEGFERGVINGAANIRGHWNEYTSRIPEATKQQGGTE